MDLLLVRCFTAMEAMMCGPFPAENEALLLLPDQQADDLRVRPDFRLTSSARPARPLAPVVDFIPLGFRFERRELQLPNAAVLPQKAYDRAHLLLEQQ